MATTRTGQTLFDVFKKKKNLLEYFWAPGGSSMVDLLVVAILSYHDVILSLPSYAFMTCDHRNTFNLRY